MCVCSFVLCSYVNVFRWLFLYFVGLLHTLYHCHTCHCKYTKIDKWLFYHIFRVCVCLCGFNVYYCSRWFTFSIFCFDGPVCSFVQLCERVYNQLLIELLFSDFLLLEWLGSVDLSTCLAFYLYFRFFMSAEIIVCNPIVLFPCFLTFFLFEKCLF